MVKHIKGWLRQGSYFSISVKGLMKQLDTEEYRLGANEKLILDDNGNQIVRRHGRERKPLSPTRRLCDI
jgi:hypothetical protein